MPFHHFLFALLVAFLWGMNFIFVKIALTEIPPLLLCSLRFFLSSIPAIFFIPPPDIPLKKLITYGFIMFGLQFGFMFAGMHVGMMPGMASLIAQSQVLFSIFFAFILLSEIPNFWQLVGASIAFVGIFIASLHFDHRTTSLLGFLLTLCAAFAWGLGNVMTRQMKNTNMLSLVIWGSFFAIFPLLILSLILEGPDAFSKVLHTASFKGFSALLYITYASTWLGYGLWSWLLTRYPISSVAPFTLLVPITGMLGSVMLLNETLSIWQLIAIFLVMGGLCVSVMSQLFKKLRID